MSWQALTWASRQRVGHQPSKHLLMLLANYADEEGSCFPTQETLADETEMTERAVRLALDRLEAGGFLSRSRARRADGTLGRARYRLHLGRVAEALVAASGEADAPRDGADSSAEPPEPRSGGPQERHAATTGTTFRSEENHYWKNHQDEREARARGAGQDGEAGAVKAAFADEPFMAFMAGWPTGAADSIERSHREWLELSEAERGEAAERAEAFVAWLKTTRRTAVVAAFTYLHEKRWKLLPSGAAKPEAAGGASIIVKPFTRPWWLVLVRRAERGERPGVMLDMARRGTGWQVPVGQVPDEVAEASAYRLDKGGRAFAAWAAWLAARGARVSAHDIPASVPFAWMPGEWPPGHGADAGEDVDFGEASGWR